MCENQRSKRLRIKGLKDLRQAGANNRALEHPEFALTVVEVSGHARQYGSIPIGAESCSDDVVPACSDSYDERRVLIASNVCSISPAELNRLGASLTYFVA